MDELKPCPFCDEMPGTAYSDTMVFCENRECPIYDRPMDVEKWNTRPGEDTLRAELERALKTMADATAALERWTDQWKWWDNPEDDAMMAEITTPAVWTGKHDPNVIVRAEPKGD